MKINSLNTFWKDLQTCQKSKNSMSETPKEAAYANLGPSAWVQRFAALVSNTALEAGTASVLDVACGTGRHTRLFLEMGCRVMAIDRDISGIADLASDPMLTAIETDLENDTGWPLTGREFTAVVVTNYLYRPILQDIVGAVDPGGALIYETFAAGNERFGRPKNPDFLLRTGELLAACAGTLAVVAYEQGQVTKPALAMVQRVAAVRLSGDQPMPPLNAV